MNADVYEFARALAKKIDAEQNQSRLSVGLLEDIILKHFAPLFVLLPNALKDRRKKDRRVHLHDYRALGLHYFQDVTGRRVQQRRKEKS